MVMPTYGSGLSISRGGTKECKRKQIEDFQPWWETEEDDEPEKPPPEPPLAS